VALGAVLVFFFFPKKDAETALVTGCHAEDSGAGATPVEAGTA
jgi:hypothetical protein